MSVPVSYPTIRSGVDVVCRPNGRYYLVMWGKPVPEADYKNGILFLDLGPNSMALYFHHCATEDHKRRKVVIAEADKVNSYLAPALTGQMIVDVVVLDDRYDLESIRIDGFQNFMATCRRLV